MFPSSITHLITILLFLLPTIAFSTSHHHNNHHDNHRHLKSIHLTLYQHETINKTGYIIVKGVTGPKVSQTTTPFGTLFAFQDPLTTTPTYNSSTIHGVVDGASITSSIDGLRSISIAKVTFNLRHYKGSVSILGDVYNVVPSDLPVVGGTGDFLFVQGYVTSSPVDLKGITVVYKLDFHLYWPPYAHRK